MPPQPFGIRANTNKANNSNEIKTSNLFTILENSPLEEVGMLIGTQTGQTLDVAPSSRIEDGLSPWSVILPMRCWFQKGPSHNPPPPLRQTQLLLCPTLISKATNTPNPHPWDLSPFHQKLPSTPTSLHPPAGSSNMEANLCLHTLGGTNLEYGPIRGYLMDYGR